MGNIGLDKMKTRLIVLLIICIQSLAVTFCGKDNNGNSAKVDNRAPEVEKGELFTIEAGEHLVPDLSPFTYFLQTQYFAKCPNDDAELPETDRSLLCIEKVEPIGGSSCVDIDFRPFGPGSASFSSDSVCNEVPLDWRYCGSCRQYSSPATEPYTGFWIMFPFIFTPNHFPCDSDEQCGWSRSDCLDPSRELSIEDVVAKCDDTSQKSLVMGLCPPRYPNDWSESVVCVMPNYCTSWGVHTCQDGMLPLRRVDANARARPPAFLQPERGGTRRIAWPFYDQIIFRIHLR